MALIEIIVKQCAKKALHMLGAESSNSDDRRATCNSLSFIKMIT
jgi:hypothetical protein